MSDAPGNGKRAIKRDKPLRFLIACWSLAAVAFSVGYAYQWKLGRDLRNAVAECEAESAKLGAKANAAPATEQDGWQEVALVCDPDDLLGLPKADALPGVQGRIRDLRTEAALQKVELPAYLISIALLLVGAAPYLWYFLLRRLTEVAAAIRGD